MTIENPKIYAALSQAIADIGIKGVGKDGTNSFQKFAYRSIDSIRQALNPVLAKNGLVIVPTVKEIDRTPGEKNGLVVTTEHTFTVYAVDGSSVAASVIMTNSSKDESKLAGQSASYAMKTAVIDLFCIPTEESDDLDSRDENGRKTSFMPKIETNKAGVNWSEPDWGKGKDAVLAWAGTMTNQDPTIIMEDTKADKDGKKGHNFVVNVRKIWEKN